MEDTPVAQAMICAAVPGTIPDTMIAAAAAAVATVTTTGTTIAIVITTMIGIHQGPTIATRDEAMMIIEGQRQLMGVREPTIGSVVMDTTTGKGIATIQIAIARARPEVFN